MLKLLHNLPVTAAVRAAAMAQFNPKAVGFNKSQSGKLMHSQQCWHLTKHTKFMQNMIQEVCNFDLQLAHHGAAQGVQGQVLASSSSSRRVGTHLHQEEEGRVGQHVVSHERGRGQEGLMPPQVCSPTQ